MGFLGRPTKAPSEEIDYDIDFSAWLDARAETIASFTTDCDSGIVVDRALQVGGIVRVFIKGGQNGRAYRVIAEITTAGGLVKRGEIQVRVRGTGELIGITIDGGDGSDLGDGLDVDGGTE